jgi:hypothetical protein
MDVDVPNVRQSSVLPLVNSTVAFALALLLMITVHELGHAVAALAQGHHPVLRPFSVDTGAAPGAQRVVTAAAGPLLSVVTGLLVLAMPLRGRPFVRLAILWFGLLSVQEFNGYLTTGPFVADGDIGVVLGESGAQGWLGVVLLVVGVAGTVVTGRVATARLLLLVDPATDVADQLRRLGLFSWLLGALLAVLLSLGAFDATANTLFEVAGLITAGVFLLFARGFYRRVDITGRAQLYGWPWTGGLALIVVALARQLFLARGLSL